MPRRRRWGRALLIAYAILLALSHLVRLVGGRFGDDPPTTLPSLQVQEIRVAGDDPPAFEATGRTVRLAYREWLPDGEPGATLLLVHGSPGSSGNFDRLAPRLAEQGLRVIAPDLPGFGDSSAQVDDYSILAHAEYCRELLLTLGVERVHALGFSLGGGVVLHLADHSAADSAAGPEVESLILLAAIGVQELELLGNFAINRAIHGAQLGLFQTIQELVPHFGVLDRSHTHLSYARNFYDSDQRPLRGLLEAWDEPMLILHGDGDVLVPYAAALEHERIVPQSELVTYDANHFMPFSMPEALVEPIVSFVEGVEGGDTTTRADATPERLRLAAEGEPQRLPRATGPTLLVWILLLMVATLVSEDLTCLAAGLLVAYGSLGFAPAVFACGAGIFLGDLGLYAIGRLGRPFIGKAPLRWFIKPADLKRSQQWFEERGALVILLSRFVPGTRLPTYVGAGLLSMNPLTFSIYLLIPVALWTPLLVSLARVAGEPILGFFETFEEWALPAMVGTLVALWITLLLGRKLASWEGRRRLVGGWRRLTHWEFWPRWAFYPPVVLYVAWLALRHRSLTLFTAANPGIPAGGGFVGESKSTILRGLDPGAVAPWTRIEPGDVNHRRDAVLAFVDGTDAPFEPGFPVVLKPDVGERGDGVAVVRRGEDIVPFLDRTPGPIIAQRFVAGAELGVFWLRRPGAFRGEIFSITDKIRPSLTGDGTSTLRRLIFADRRAVALADTYLEALGDRAESVPAEGESVQLVDLGTHCRGAVFLDGETYRTPELEAAVEAAASSLDGFHFGRFDLRAPSYDHFRRGEDIWVLELNGVSSEATHIYDPKHGLFEAWGILFRQWRLAFAIGAGNRDAGHAPLTLGHVMKLLRAYGARP
ncbi:MAG: alpha/beta fold hydrolase [Acidobacteriota bacterium]